MAAEGETDNAWLVDMVVQFMHSPSWNHELSRFMDEKCLLFDNFQEENRHEYLEAHNEFKSLVDSLLAAHLLEVDITPETFEQQCVEAGLVDDPHMQQVLGQLLAAEDFLVFKQMMVDRHLAMQAQAEQTYKEMAGEAQTAQAVATCVEAPAATSAPTAVAPAPSPQGVPVLPSAMEERRFGAAGGAYGRAALSGARKPASNEKAAAIRKALCSAIRPK